MSGRPAAQDWVAERLGYHAREPGLFEAALTHRSAAGPNNERLEFLGDAVINLLVAEQLYRDFAAADEGELSRLRARLVSAEPLARVALGLGLGEALQMGSGELKTGGFRRQSILADAFEAVVGAVYLDGGLDAARGVVGRTLGPQVASVAELPELKDAKTRLQEYLQARGHALPAYFVEQVSGEPHQQTFAVRCEVRELGLVTRGAGSTRRRAEQEAAQRLLDGIG